MLDQVNIVHFWDISPAGLWLQPQAIRPGTELQEMHNGKQG